MNADSSIDRPLPHSIEAERAVLGSILLGSPSKDEAMLRLQPPDFFLSEHQVIYRHLKRLVKEGLPTDDTVLLYESLRTTNELEAAGGIAYVSQIADGLPRVSNIAHYVEIVKVRAQLRQRAYTAEMILGMALGANGNALDVLREISDLSAQLREEVEQNRILKFRSGAEIAMATDEQIEWIVPGFVVRGGITELGAKVKAGTGH